MTNPLHRILPAARSRIERVSDAAPARRDVLKIGGGMVAGSVVGQVFLDPVTEPLADRVKAAVWGERRIETYRANAYSLERVETHGNAHQQAALAAWRGGIELPAFVIERATMTYPGQAGDQWVEWQGEIASRLLWGARQPRNVPMRARPDRAFGEWAERRVREWRDQPEPVYARIVGEEVEQVTGERRRQDYSILGLPLRSGRVLTVSAPWPGTPEVPTPRVPMRHSRDDGFRYQPRSSTI